MCCTTHPGRVRDGQSSRRGAAWSVWAVVAWLVLLPGAEAARAQAIGRLEWTIVDLDTREPLPCRIHLKDAQGRSIRVGKFPFWHDHFSTGGSLVVLLPPGKYFFEVERGPEWGRASGYFLMRAASRDRKTIGVRRLVDMSQRGWWGADMRVHRNPKDMPVVMNAEDLPLAQMITWSPEKNPWQDRPVPQPALTQLAGQMRWMHLLGGVEHRRGGTLLYLNLDKPLSFDPEQAGLPSLLPSLQQAQQQGAWIDVADPQSWELPVWLALGRVRSIQVASASLLRSGSATPNLEGYVPDRRRLAAPWGQALWHQYIYFQVLNAGFRIPPSGGSGSGLVGNPVGYNRVYVHAPGKFDPKRWWNRFAQGRVIVTNGPLLRPSVAGHPPGEVFDLPGEEPLVLDALVELDSRDPVRYVEVLHNGQVVHRVPVPQLQQNAGRIEGLRFYEPGWFLFRAVAEVPQTYRFALSGPYYIQRKKQTTVRRSAVRFFLRWLQQSRRRLRIANRKQRAEIIQLYKQAEQFWTARLNQAQYP